MKHTRPEDPSYFLGPEKERVIWCLFLHIRSTGVRKSKSMTFTIANCNESLGREDHRIAWEIPHRRVLDSCQVAVLYHCELKLDFALWDVAGQENADYYYYSLFFRFAILSMRRSIRSTSHSISSEVAGSASSSFMAMSQRARTNRSRKVTSFTNTHLEVSVGRMLFEVVLIRGKSKCAKRLLVKIRG